ncbi:hypothetical protein A9Q84_13495 [Halobacteriovorax marinus]|uniref:phosphoribosylaminoimidazolesuccinocarboxamide synthase n=1 Tax=Halobacteriovorax marinus TaxID=97084 RepID=A0A1Y5F8X3_9BACT|nr:hypothetical protein A9Q84_13495 [Halobacteriovorax marinus]
MELIKKGSVKDIYTSNGNLYFNFSNRYSIFDWGEMPDEIPNKGNSLLNFTKNIFEFLESSKCWKDWTPKSSLLEGNYYLSKEFNRLKSDGLKTHFSNVHSENGKDYLGVRRVAVPELELKNNAWDYSPFKEKVTNTLVPLEIIFRFGVPKGSSLLKRTSDKNYLDLIGLKKAPVVGDKFEMPVIEFSTKLEERDRYISFEEAKEISGMSCVEFEVLRATTTLLALRLKEYFAECDIELWDGKFEFAFDDFSPIGHREFMLVDSVGPDELRLTKDGVQLSKEVLRQFYLESPWYKNVVKAKKIAKESNRKDWKVICTDELASSPSNLADDQLKLVEDMYLGLEKVLLDSNYKMDTVLDSLKRLM